MFRLSLNTIYGLLKIAGLYLIAISLLSCSGSDEQEEVIVDDESLEIKGADMSLLPEVRKSGLSFYNKNNEQEDLLKTLKSSGVNVIRLRLWKQPADPNSGFQSVKNLSAEIKNTGLKTLISVHYSDSWADPGTQSKPDQWKNINFEQLKDSVYNYTKKIMTEINPDYIQIGNEINSGLLWPEGNISNPAQMKALLQKGISAVRETNSKTKIIIHFAGISNADWFFSTISGLDYDVIGISYYSIWHGKDLNALQQSLVSLSETNNKDIFIAETAYPFTLDWKDFTNNIIGLNSQILSEYPASPQGQKDYLIKISDLIKEVPRGIGYCYWGSEWVSYKGNTANNGSPWENQAFWDFSNKSLPVLEAY
ncbi:MAG: glycosyl hydrolase 53 family protein [Flavobacteriaceae bacterium]|nr:glycosyl hydrolase 53 family protein [Flavobacteriaceae bacterium]